MCSSEESSRSASSRRANNLNLLTVTPAFPIPISSDILFNKEVVVNFARNRRPSAFAIDELSPDSQFKLFSPDNLLSDRLSLVSNESISSVSETEKDRSPIDQDKICAQLSDWFIRSMEERKWAELTEGIDFRDEVDPVRHFGPALSPGTLCEMHRHSERSGDDDKSGAKSAEEFHRREGNSVFYAICDESTAQMASTSRSCDLSARCCDFSPPLPPMDRRRRHSSEWRQSVEKGAEGQGLLAKRTNSIQQLISALSENSPPSPKSLRRFDALRTFPFPSLRVPFRKWRPPKKEFIYEHSKPMDFITQLALQKHRCAGCGLKLDHVYVKRTLYCHYFSKLFCQCCHQGTKTRIPALILHEWNFKEYPVSDIALKFLLDNADQPVFDVRLVNPGLYRRAKNLRKFRKLRVKISHMLPFVQMCKLAAELMTENGMTMFASVPKRFLSLESVDVYSLLDFERIANKNLIELVEPLASRGAAHIENCERCRQNAFLCQVCMDNNDLLFPFQTERCYRCDGCGSLTHWKCYRKVPNDGQAEGEVRCEKCERIRRKKCRLQRNVSTDRSACGSE
ncbi:hypothetical protein niasHS_014169 [Heterodera schachtii]|uniref:Rubicon Homology domain-containing protein n=1 Tax=Heterodera schachtii TaxID=97005 RepID=A0ABD2IL53_HETSC